MWAYEQLLMGLRFVFVVLNMLAGAKSRLGEYAITFGTTLVHTFLVLIFPSDTS